LPFHGLFVFTEPVKTIVVQVEVGRRIVQLPLKQRQPLLILGRSWTSFPLPQVEIPQRTPSPFETFIKTAVKTGARRARLWVEDQPPLPISS